MKIGELTGRGILEGPLFGVEVEVEGAKLPNRLAGFRVIEEQSLREVAGEPGREYVFLNPLALDATLHYLDKLRLALYKEGQLVVFSPRTSIHVHVNVSDFTVPQWFTFLFLWVLYEEALIDFCGTERKGNLFCLSSRDAEGLLFQLERFANNGNIHEFNDDYRYSAVNTAATCKYGSLEFRSMRGTLDEYTLTSWIRTLYNLRLMAIDIGSPEKLIEEVLDNEPKITKKIFGDNHFVYGFPNLSRSVMAAAFRCATIIDNANWNRFDIFEEPEFDL